MVCCVQVLVVLGLSDFPGKLPVTLRSSLFDAFAMYRIEQYIAKCDVRCATGNMRCASPRSIRSM